MITMRPFDLVARLKAGKWKVMSKMLEKRLMLKVGQHFSLVETTFSRQGILSENVVLDTLLKKSVRKN